MRKLLVILVMVSTVLFTDLIVRWASETTVEAQAKTSLTAGVGTPTLDGIESEGEWTSDSITTSRGVTVKAMIDDINLYVLATWEDSTDSVAKDQWTFDGTNWNGLGDEDRISFIWDMKDENGNSLNGDDGAACATMCHTPIMRTNVGRVDVWHWKAHRFNPMGFSDDKYWDTCQDCGDGGRHGDGGSGSGDRNRNEEKTAPVYMAASDPGANVDFLADDQSVLDAFDPFGVEPGSVDLRVPFDNSAQFAVGAEIPGRQLATPTGNRASVRSAGKWANGMWTVEFSRPLAGEVGLDGKPEDFAVPLGGSVDFTSETFDDVADHSRHIFETGAAETTADTKVYTLNFPDPTTLYFAQFADGSGISSQITLFNLNEEQGAATTILLKDDAGEPLTVDLNGEEVNGELEVIIPAGSLRRFETDGLGDTVVGSVTVESDGNLAGVILFGGTTGLAGVGSSVALDEVGFTAPMEVNTGAGTDTGIAVMNLEAQEVTLDLQLCDEDGGVLATAQMALPAMGHRALFVTEVEWDTVVDFSDFDGLLKVTATGSTSATVIQTRPSQLATMPVAAN